MERESMNFFCQILGVVIGNAAIIVPLWLWSRAENRADMREVHNVQAADRRDILNMIEAIKEEGRIFRQTMADESREFHGRLCAIEERNKR